MAGTKTLVHNTFLQMPNRFTPPSASASIPLLVEMAQIERMLPTDEAKAAVEKKMKTFRRSCVRRLDKVIYLHTKRLLTDYYKALPDGDAKRGGLSISTGYALYATMCIERIYESVGPSGTTGTLALFEQALDAVMNTINRDYFLLPKTDVPAVYAEKIDVLLRSSLGSVGMDTVAPYDVFGAVKSQLGDRVRECGRRFKDSCSV